MKISNRRIALLTGASVAVLGIAAPAYAATTVTPSSQCGASDTLDITLVGDTGVTSDNNPALAVVNGCATGEIIQGPPAGGDVTATMTNGTAGDVNIVASANASNTAGNATATASIVGPGVNQIGEGTGVVDITINNAGHLSVDAIANATATGVAHASANFTGVPFGYGVYQSANGFTLGGATTASAMLSNAEGASLTVLASANANGATATANAHQDWGIWQIANGASTINVGLTNAGTINIDSIANANGTAGAANASASLIGGIVQDGYSGSTMSVNLDNSGTIGIDVSAVATGATDAVADAHMLFGIAQTANVAGSGVASITNDGTINVSANAAANGATLASANAIVGGGGSGAGIAQVVNATGGTTGAATISNNGALTINAAASAVATGTALANASVDGVVQEVFGRNGGAATASLVNGTAGAIDITASANASGANAEGTTVVATGGGTSTLATPGASASVVGIHQIASATGTRTTVVGAGAAATTITVGGTAVASVANSGTINVAANATANGTGAASALANVAGIVQTAIGTGGLASVSNAGVINVSAVANAFAPAAGTATATGPLTGAAVASASVTGIAQSAGATATIVNSGTLNVLASANASGATSAVANANALGASQNASSLAIANSGTINVTANANAVAVPFLTATGTATTATGVTPTSPAGGSAHAMAVGYVGNGALPVGAVNVATISNSGTINVNANATAPVTAVASAQGIVLNAPTTSTTTTPVGGTGPVTTVTGGALLADITNSGTLSVMAKANGLGTTATTVTNTTAGGATTTVVTTFPHSSAFATGIRLNAGALATTVTTTTASGAKNVTVTNSTITNSGTINVEAVTNGGDAEAYGIRVVNNGTTAPGGGELIINNSGDIIARYSVDGGTTFHRATAIDVSAAPSPTVINLLGGNITGDINVQDGDAINVTTGETMFNGVINAGCFDSTAIAAGGDNPALSSCGVGTLTIGDGAAAGGNLHLTIDPVDGPSYAFVNTLTVNADGTLTLDLPAANGGTAAPGTYPQIFADTANLDGTLVANIASAGNNGLYDSMVYDNVIDANVRNGEFAQCQINGIPTSSLLLHAGCVYDDDNNVDLAITRTPFDQVAGLNANGAAVGTGLDSYYDVTLTGGAATMFGNLFLITDAANYNIALNQLSGSVYANYLNSFPSLGVHENDLVAKATDCEVPALAGSVLECRASAPIHVWGQLDYQTRKMDGDVEAGDSRGKRFTGLLGVDASMGNSAIIGADIGYLTNNVRDHQFGDNAKGNGWTVGAYAVYDPGSFFLKGVTTYSSLNGDSTRHINFTGLGAGTGFTANPDGSPDVKMWTFGLHGGARLPMGATSVITPYLNWDYVNAKLQGFSEDNGNGAELTVDGSKSNHSYLTGGVKWATQMGGVVPEVNLGYRYRFGNSRSSFHGWFTPDPENDFDILSSAQKKGTFLAGLSVGGKMGPVDLRIGYEGEFNGSVTSHSGNFKIVVPLGSRAAPPPPPVVAPPPPPPPPPPATQTCPDGSVIDATATCPPPPPPPPAPVERGERGQ